MRNEEMDPGRVIAAAELRRRIEQRGLTIAEFRRRSGLTRNVVYALTMGRPPRTSEKDAIDRVLGPDS